MKEKSSISANDRKNQMKAYQDYSKKMGLTGNLPMNPEQDQSSHANTIDQQRISEADRKDESSESQHVRAEDSLLAQAGTQEWNKQQTEQEQHIVMPLT